MSTMYDALRKAEAEHKKAAGLGEKSPESGKPTVNAEMPQNTKTMVLLVAVIAVFVILFFRIKGLMGEQKKSVAVTAIKPQTPGAAAEPVKPPRAPGTYDLDGVIDAGDHSMAIINGKLVSLEGTIDNLVLKKISPKEAELLNTKDNSTVVLKIK